MKKATSMTSSTLLPRWASRLLDPSGAQRIEEAVIAAERGTSGEIVPMLVERSTPIGHIFPLLLATFVALFYASNIASWLGPWRGEHALWVLGDLLILGLLAWLVSKSQRIQRWLTGIDDPDEQVMRRAMVEFHTSHFHQTRHATGILLLASVMERRAVVLADHAIAQRLPAETWQSVVDDMLQGLHRGDAAQGFCTAIARCGELLKPHFPIQAGDQNELKNHFVIKS